MIAFNAAAQLSALGGILVFQTAYLILIARFLGVDDFGRFSLAFSITQMMLMGGDLGLHNTAIRRISSRPERSAEIFPRFFSLKCMLSVALFLAVLLIAILLDETPETKRCLVFLGAGMALHSIGLSLSITCQAHGKLYLASLNAFLLVALQSLVGLAGLWLGGRLVWVGAAYPIAALTALLLNWKMFSTRIHEVRWVSPRHHWAFFRASLPVGLGIFFESVASRLPIVLLSSLAGSYQTGLYASAFRITGALRNIPVALLGAVLPVLAAHQGRPAEVRRLVQKSLAVMVGISLPLAAGLSYFSGELIQLLYGQSYSAAGGALNLLAWSLVPLFVGLIFNNVLLSQHRLVGRLPFVTGATLLVATVLNLLLIPLLGSQGAAWSTLATEAFAAILFLAAVWKFLK